METLETIRKEISDFAKSKNPEDIRITYEGCIFCVYFNNFHLNLPFGGRRDRMKDYLDDIRFATRRGEVLRVFYANIDRIVQEAGIDLELLRRLQADSKRIIVRENLFKLTLPAYLILRNRGYNKTDLTS
jgi:hypothetical protein